MYGDQPKYCTVHSGRSNERNKILLRFVFLCIAWAFSMTIETKISYSRKCEKNILIVFLKNTFLSTTFHSDLI